MYVWFAPHGLLPAQVEVAGMGAPVSGREPSEHVGRHGDGTRARVLEGDSLASMR